jgi:aspartate/methionine/tyrosine aminotransferase
MAVIAFEKLGRITQIQKDRLDTNRKLLRECLESQSLLEYFWPEHGTVVFPRVSNGRASELCDRLRRDYELSVVPGTFFEDAERIRIGVGGRTEEVRASLEQLASALRHGLLDLR